MCVCAVYLFIIFSLQNELVLMVLARYAGEGFCIVDSSFWHLWCCSLKHCHFCIDIIGRTNLPAFLIPLVKMLYLVVGATSQDRILIAQKLTELLNFDPL